MTRNTFIPYAIGAAFVALATTAQAADTPKNDQSMVTQAAHGGHAEVKAGNMAKAQAAQPDVRSFGEQMVTDHTRAGNELETIAKTNQWTYPADTDAEHKQMLDRLSTKKGAEFDKAYMADMVAGHQKMVALLETMSKDATNAQLKDWARRTLPVVQGHLKMAQDLHAKVR